MGWFWNLPLLALAEKKIQKKKTVFPQMSVWLQGISKDKRTWGSAHCILPDILRESEREKGGVWHTDAEQR